VETKKRTSQVGEGGVQAHPGLLTLYRACITNAEELLEDARLLLSDGRFARAFALAFTAYEELGKSQVVADAYSGAAAASELTAAFRKHDLKTAYMRRTVRLEVPPGQHWPEATIEYDAIDAGQLFGARQRSLYVDFGVDYLPTLPIEAITRARAEEMATVVDQELKAIAWAEDLNGRIGTKGLFK
jgi:AbiV family abortive infection protein